MPFFEKDGSVSLFVHIPKTGGSSIEAHLQKFSKMFFYSSGRLQSPITRVSPQHYPVSALRSIFGNGFWVQGFAIVRNPFDRIVSEYNYQKNLFWPTIPPFEIWLEKVLHIARDDPFYLDNHLRPQVDFVDNTLRIFKYEAGLDKIILEIEKTMNIESNSKLPVKLKFDSPSVSFSSRSIDAITKFYGADFSVFKYSTTPLSGQLSSRI